MIDVVGFDGDDTLWHSEGYYRQAEEQFHAILGGYLDLDEAHVRDVLLSAERRNIRLFGYGAKGMTLSMVETAIEATAERISAADIHRIVALGKEVLAHPVEILPGVREALAQVAESHPLVLITKGDLFHQEAKIASSGLADCFLRVEIVSEKDQATYARVLQSLAVPASRFVMVGNSLRSDIEPVVRLGGFGVHVPYHLTWAHELDADVAGLEGRLIEVASAHEVPMAIRRLGNL